MIGNQQGLFTYKYHWLLVTEETIIHQIEDKVDNIIHLSAITSAAPLDMVIKSFCCASDELIA